MPKTLRLPVARLETLELEAAAAMARGRRGRPPGEERAGEGVGPRLVLPLDVLAVEVARDCRGVVKQDPLVVGVRDLDGAVEDHRRLACPPLMRRRS